MKKLIVILLMLPVVVCGQQQRENHWVFGDSTGIDFSAGVPVPYTSGKSTAGENVGSISDGSGHLLFYTGKLSTSDLVGSYINESIYNKNFQVVENGDSIVTQFGANASSLFLPKPGSNNLYYLFYINEYNLVGPDFSEGLYYSVLDASANSGNGKCIDKNHPLLDSAAFSEHIAAVRHANGRDWWIMTYRVHWDSAITFLLDTSGIHGPYYQSIQIGTNILSSRCGQMVFTQDGSKVGLVEYNVMNIFDFDRCTGQLSNPQYYGLDDIHTETTMNLYGCAFSPNGQYFYFGGFDNMVGFVDSVYQLSISNNHITRLFGDTSHYYILGQYKLAYDGKIYIAGSTLSQGWGVNTYGQINTHLSVINAPDIAGTACNFAAYSFDLGGRRSFGGLPNIPNFSLYQLPGSPCDTLGVGINEMEFDANIVWGIYPNPAREYFSVFITNPKMQDIYKVKVYDMLGRNILQELLCVKEGECKMKTTEFPPGLYMVELEMNGVRLGGKKLVIE